MTFWAFALAALLLVTVIPCPAAARQEVLSLTVDTARCPQVDRVELERVLDLELSTTEALTTAALHVTLACSDEALGITVALQDHEGATRTTPLPRFDLRSAEREIALATMSFLCELRLAAQPTEEPAPPAPVTSVASLPLPAAAPAPQAQLAVAPQPHPVFEVLVSFGPRAESLAPAFLATRFALGVRWFPTEHFALGPTAAFVYGHATRDAGTVSLYGAFAGLELAGVWPLTEQVLAWTAALHVEGGYARAVGQAKDGYIDHALGTFAGETGLALGLELRLGAVVLGTFATAGIALPSPAARIEGEDTVSPGPIWIGGALSFGFRRR